MPSINAHVTKVEQDTTTGWFRISTDDPTIKRVDTKKPEIAQAAAEAKKAGWLAALEITTRSRTIADGRTFENHYLEAIVPAQGSLNGDSGIDVITPTSRKTDPGDAWRITLAASAKLAVGCIPLLQAGGYQVNLEALQRLTLKWAEFLWATPAPSGDLGLSPDLGLETAAATYGESRPVFSDDDIPF